MFLYKCKMTCSIVSMGQVLLGLLSVWNVSFLGYPARVSTSPFVLLNNSCFFIINRSFSITETLVHTQAILPYSQALEKFAPHIQQVCLLLSCDWMLMHLLIFFPHCSYCLVYVQTRLAWKVMARVFQLMVCHYHLRLVKLILANQEQMGSTVFINLYTRWDTDSDICVVMTFWTLI